MNREVSEACVLFRDLVRALVTKPEAVALQPSTSNNETLFYLKVADNDVFIILGENEEALAHLLSLAGRKHNQLWELKLWQELTPAPLTEALDVR